MGKKICGWIGKVLIAFGLIWLIGIAGGDDYNSMIGKKPLPIVEYKEAFRMVFAGFGLRFISKFNFKKAIKKMFND